MIAIPEIYAKTKSADFDDEAKMDARADVLIWDATKFTLTKNATPITLLRFWGKMTMPNAGIMAYRRARPLPGSRVLGEEQ